MALTLAGMLLSSCASSGPMRPASDRLALWTPALRAQQPEEAFAAVYAIGSKRLVFLGARHDNRPGSATFGLIGDAYSTFELDQVIVEGFPTSRGPNPQFIIDYASQEPRVGLVPAGELSPAVLGALKEGAEFWGGEPEDEEVKSRVLAQGFDLADILGFYVLRSIPQWISERKIEHAGDPRLHPLVEQELMRARSRLKIAENALPTFAQWAEWYRKTNGQPIGQGFVTEEVGPVHGGRFASNRIAAAVSRARDAHLHELIVDRLQAGKSILVVFGGSHLMIHRPALDAVMGPPCYTGARLAEAVIACR